MSTGPDMYNVQWFLILVFLLPGFLTLKVRDSLWVTGKDAGTFDKIVDALMFALLDYGVLSILTLIFFPDILVNLRWNALIHADTPTKHLAEVLGAASVIGAILGLVVGRLRAWDVPHRWLCSIRAANASQEPSPWVHAFTQYRNTILRITMDDGRTIIGKPASISEEEKDASLFIAEASIVDTENVKRSIDGPGILLTKSAGIKTIEFWGQEHHDGEEYRNGCEEEGKESDEDD